MFGSITNKFSDNLNLSYNFSLDNDYSTFEHNDLNATISINNFVTTFNFIEQRNEIGSTHLLSNVTEYQINDNSSIKFSTRRNKKINLTEYYNLSYEYKNDCLKASLEYNKDYYSDRDIKPDESIFFKLTFVPFGQTSSPNLKK